MVGKPNIPQEEVRIRKDLNLSQNSRKVKGYAIISKGDIPKEIAKNRWEVKSQRIDKVYTVTKERKWRCTCIDYKHRTQDCKHIFAVKFWINYEEEKCIYCNSSKVSRNGRRGCNGGSKQRYLCGNCKRTFIDDKDFDKIKGDARTTSLILDLYFKGVSLRKISDHLFQFYDIKLDCSNVLRRVQKFMKIINDYVKNFKPELGKVWKADEMMVKCNGKWKWLWNMMDDKTKFQLANIITEKRRIKDARKLLKNSKEVSNGSNPKFFITDGLHAYSEAFKKEFPSRKVDSEHIRFAGIRARVNNNTMERYHATVREREKTMRGLDNKKSAELFIDGFRDYYNFIKIHQSLGTTPAKAAGIDLKLDRNRWLSLIRQALEKGSKST